MATAVVVGTLEMIDQDEEVALELSNWIGRSDRIFRFLVSFHCQKMEGRGGLHGLYLFLKRYCWKKYFVSFGWV